MQNGKQFALIRFHVTPKKILWILAGNTLIALIIHALFPGNLFLGNLLNSQCIGISCATSSIAAANHIKTRSPGLQIMIITAGVIAGAVIGMVIAAVAGQIIFTGTLPTAPLGKLYVFIRSNLVLALMFSAIGSYVVFSLQQISDEKIKRLEVEKSFAVTEIKLLQSQMEPHFLFNTLSNILGLIDLNPDKAKQMLGSFTAFLRASLVTARSETVALSQEMDVVKNYLDIFTVRMGDRLRCVIDVPESLRAVRIPPLLVQPLVENAVKHGLEPSVRGGELSIRGVREGGHVRIIVADSGTGINEKSPGNGIGLENIKRRLELLYDGRARLFFEENEPSGVKVVIEIPYETDNSDHR